MAFPPVTYFRGSRVTCWGSAEVNVRGVGRQSLLIMAWTASPAWTCLSTFLMTLT